MDLSLQLDLSLRLLLAAIGGAAIGLEREIHDHPAGMRTHLLVAMGSALFAILSGTGYEDAFHQGIAAAPDPTRIAAQIVTGVGFLGAGAIIHQGNIIRGLTTAASLWATAAVGLAAGTGQYILGFVAVAIMLISLGPLNAIAARIHPTGSRAVTMRIEIASLHTLGAVSARIAAASADLSSINSRKLGKGRYEITMEVRLPRRTSANELLAGLSNVEGVESVDASDIAEA
jgi:putative Mg2+ transporter-C (MgtC) family protein